MRFIQSSTQQDNHSFLVDRIRPEEIAEAEWLNDLL